MSEIKAKICCLVIVNNKHADVEDNVGEDYEENKNFSASGFISGE